MINNYENLGINGWMYKGMQTNDKTELNYRLRLVALNYGHRFRLPLCPMNEF